MLIRLIFLLLPALTLGFNKTSKSLFRDKRFIIFTNGATLKAVIGIAIPVEFGDDPKRSLLCGYNFQSQYLTPTRVYTPYDSPLFTGASKRSHRDKRVPEDEEDFSRQIVYRTLDLAWKRKGRSGRQCLLRAICEIAQNPLSHNGLFGEIVDAIFTPGEDTKDSEILDAHKAGLYGVNCLKLFSECPMGNGFLDAITVSF